MKVRVVVTGHSPAGKAVVASDTKVDGITIGSLGSEFHRLWGGGRGLTLPRRRLATSGAALLPARRRLPLRACSRCRPTPSHAPPSPIPRRLLPELEAKLPGLAEPLEPDAPGMHTTDTIDFEYVISGRVVLELDDGATVELGPGDTVVQNGTRHAWRNPFDEPCRMVVFLVGAERTG